MANTYVKIASYTATGTVTDITFTSIPATYTDLVLKMSLRTNGAVVADDVALEFNGITSTAFYAVRQVGGNGSSVYSNTGPVHAAGYETGSSATASTFGSTDIYIPNYANTSYAKSYSTDSVTENNATQANQTLQAGLWNPTTQAAISSIKMYPGTGSFVIYSTAYLYGVKNA